MVNITQEIWDLEQPVQLSRTLAGISDVQNVQNFLRDVLTEKEIIEISARLEAAKMLQASAKYTDIVAKTKLSSRTVARISDWLKNGTGGYGSVLETTAHHSHLPPARAE